MIYLLLLLLLGMHLLVLFAVLVWLFVRKRNTLKPVNAGLYPMVSILIAARNEERNILACMEAAYKLNYPLEKYEVLIGNDSSNDNTAAIIEGFIKDKPNFRMLNITGNLGLAKGKANVLAHLAHEAKGEYFYITDADIRVPEQWIHTLLKPIQGQKSVVSGTSIVRAGGLWGQLQEWEWLYLYMINSFMQDFTPVTCSGNNMALPAKAYWETGGYENIEFSVTEDYQLWRELKKRGYKHKQLFEKDATAWSAPVYNFHDLLRQRKRWLSGGKDLPVFFWALLIIYSMFLPALACLFLFSVKAGLVILCIKMMVEVVLLFTSSRQLRFSLKLLMFPLFEVYLYSINIITFFYYFLPGKVEWKGRKY
jgi:cellulose synthase/poly-beta-1,6-N-acetylglucosamine synthase-like glycosyltransferase